MKKLILFLVLAVSGLNAQNYGKVVIYTKLNMPFLSAMNGVRLSNQYQLKNTYEYLEENNYSVKIWFQGFQFPINFNVAGSPGYESIFVIEKDNLGAYALTLESKVKFGAIAPTNNTVAPTNTTVVTNTVPVQPMASDKDFKALIASIESEHFDDGKLEKAKSFYQDLYLTSDQAKTVMKNFTWDDAKLNFSKYVYARITDKQNFYRVYDLFSFSSSKKDLQDYVKKQK